jgi:phage replication initiation protein
MGLLIVDTQTVCMSGHIQAGQPQARGGAAARLARSGPRAVTRGESTNGQEVEPKAKVDWLNCTFDQPAMSLEGLIAFMGCVFGNRPTTAKLDGGLFGFTERWKLFVYQGGCMTEVGAICRGGEAQRGRWMLQITGKGCGVVSDWSALRELLEGFGAKLTRVDLAVDFVDGAHTVDEAVAMVRDDQFTSCGRRPSTSVAGDWLDEVHGRTLYVGKAANGKMLRVYEKGKQLGDLSSEWVRFEVQFGNRDRVIPFDALTDCDKFFTGAYPALASMLEAAAEAIPTSQTETLTNIGHLLYHLKRCYGKALHQAGEVSGASHTDLVEAMTVIGMPRRLTPSGVVAGLAWAEIESQIRSYQQ